MEITNIQWYAKGCSKIISRIRYGVLSTI
jgi:hypothetical protein